MIELFFAIYSVIAFMTFLFLLWSRHRGKITYTEYPVQNAVSQLGEYGWFALISLLWPIVLIGMKVKK